LFFKGLNAISSPWKSTVIHPYPDKSGGQSGGQKRDFFLPDTYIDLKWWAALKGLPASH